MRNLSIVRGFRDQEVVEIEWRLDAIARRAVCMAMGRFRDPTPIVMTCQASREETLILSQ